MKNSILLMLTVIFSSSYGKYCNIENDRLHLICQPEDTKPIHYIRDESVGCLTGTVEALRENIKTIDIATCRFDNFNLFKNFTTLRFSFFHEIKSIRKEALVGLNQLERIQVGYSNAEVLDSAFSDLPNLRQVDIYDNKLTLNEFAFKGAHQLKLLILSDFERSLLPRGFFRDLNGLEYLNLGTSKFQNLSDIDFTGLGRVKWLRLDMNRVSNLTGNSFDCLKGLKYLNFNYNRLVDIDSMAFSKLNNLIVLNLSGNQIEELNDGAFSGLTNLMSLNLYNNYIDSIKAGAFSTMKNLKKLDLTNNRLTALHEHTFKELDNLLYLSLKQNSLSTISVNTFAALTKLIQLDLSSQRYGFVETSRYLETIDLNAFPQFIDLETKTLIRNPISSEPDNFQKAELLWIKDILSINKDWEIQAYQREYFGSFSLNENDFPQIDLNNFSLNKSSGALIFGNLDLSDNRVTSINFEKRH